MAEKLRPPNPNPQSFPGAGAALPEGVQTQTLSQVLACGVAVGSTACLALKQAGDAKALGHPTAQRLQLGLMGFSAGEP